MKSLSDFSKEKLEKENKKISEDDIKEAYDKYKNLSEDELLSTPFKEVDKQKQNGTFDLENLKSLVSSMSPMLTDEQLNNINNLLERLR